MKAVIGIDPGAKGAAFFKSEGRTELIKLMPLEAFLAFLKDYKRWYDITVYLERVGAMPSDGKHNAFAFGKNTGSIVGICAAYDLPIIEIAPQVWQREFRLGSRFPDKKLRKHAHVSKAKKLFPKIKVTLETADAILIAEYGYRRI
jgi:hypothetical protein